MSGASDATVLVGFADALSAPEVVWSLVGAGFHVHAWARKGSAPAPRRSRFVRLRYVADPAVRVADTIDDLESMVTQLGSPILMPLDDGSMWLMQELAKRVHVRVAGPTGAQAEVALDKRLQIAAAAAAGFRVPPTDQVQSGSDLARLSRFPAIVKPALAARVIDGQLGRGRSFTLSDSSECVALSKRWRGREPMLAQSFIDGVGEGVFGLATDDGVVCWSGHRRIRMMNPAGSGASACQSVTPSEEVCTVAERFLNAINWRGMFMIELLRDRDGQLWFVELNGRAWGSMALARRRGYEYPAWAVRQLLIPGFVPEAPAQSAPIVCRHLGREFLHALFVLRGPRSKHRTGWPPRSRSLLQVFRLHRGDHWYNDNEADPALFWADAWRTVMSAIWPPLTRTPRRTIRRLYQRIKVPIVRHEQSRLRASGGVCHLLRKGTRVLFLCYGNINRSALAEQSLKTLLGGDCLVSSCGFHGADGRPLDPTMTQTATERGIILEPWSSKTISRRMVASADLILAMEASHLIRLRAEYPETRSRSFLLSCVTKPGTIPLEIEDPYGRDHNAYIRCVHEIVFAVTAMSERMGSGPQADLAPEEPSTAILPPSRTAGRRAGSTEA
jgi:protein-tyrosine-phosphatase